MAAAQFLELAMFWIFENAHLPIMAIMFNRVGSARTDLGFIGQNVRLKSIRMLRETPQVGLEFTRSQSEF